MNKPGAIEYCQLLSDEGICSYRGDFPHLTTFTAKSFKCLMSAAERSVLTPYYSLREEIDSLCESLEKVHEKQLNCKKGCDLCCMAISVFPVEFYAIRAELDFEALPELPIPTDAAQCRFLVDHSCTIYNSRPIICRTHGLPLLYRSMDSEEYELSLCELNFKEYDFEDFDEENTYPMDRINSQLYRINKDFAAGFEGGRYNEQDRIPLSDLIALQQ